MRPTSARWTITILMLVVASCTTQAPLLNSERIRQQYGSYGVQILQADGHKRISNLYSGAGDERICRTLALVEFATPMPQALEREHANIAAGGSIGEVFRDAGWTITKHSIAVTETEPAALDVDVAALMKLADRAPLATYVYRFDVQRGQQQYQYATITEIYHPDYQTSGDLTTQL